MATSFITPEEIIELKKQYPNECLFTLEPSKTKSNRNTDFPTYYVPFTCKRLKGPPTSLHLKIVLQILASGAKITAGQTVETATDVRIMFRKLSKEDFDNTEYDPEKIPELLERNHKLIQAFEIISDEYVKMVENQVYTYKGKEFIRKNKTIFPFGQAYREATQAERESNSELMTEDGKIKLDYVLYRISIPVVKDTKKLGYQYANTHQYVVFDARKSNKKNNYKCVPAMVKNDGKYYDLTVSNADQFITSRSLVGGTIRFSQICLSKSGISLLKSITNLHVWPYLSKHNPSDTLTEQDHDEFANIGLKSFVEDDVIEEPEEKHVEDFSSDDEKTVKTKKVMNKPVKTNKNKKINQEVLDDDESDEEVLMSDESPELSDDEINSINESSDEEINTESNLDNRSNIKSGKTNIGAKYQSDSKPSNKLNSKSDDLTKSSNKMTNRTTKPKKSIK